MRHTWDLMPPGASPSRFVAIAVPSAGESRLWSIDDNPALRPAGEAYLADVRAAFPEPDGLDAVIATRLVQYAGASEPIPNLVYLSILALTDLHDGQSVVIEVGGGALRIRPLPGTYAESMESYDALGLDAAPVAAP